MPIKKNITKPIPVVPIPNQIKDSKDTSFLEDLSSIKDEVINLKVRYSHIICLLVGFIFGSLIFN